MTLIFFYNRFFIFSILRILLSSILSGYTPSTTIIILACIAIPIAMDIGFYRFHHAFRFFSQKKHLTQVYQPPKFGLMFRCFMFCTHILALWHEVACMKLNWEGLISEAVAAALGFC